MDDRRLVQVVPSPRQLKLQQLEFYAFIHFGINTFTNREWGDGTEDPALFAPARLDTRQWVKALKAAGMRGMILTCKHHDGFCLWPSRHTRHSVASSPCTADVVGLAAQACREEGMAFGVYLSPWDRNHPLYGTGKPYDDYFVAQLTELLTGYGDVFSVWFDGACGEGPNGKKQRYDWDRYFETVRILQPGACIHVCGPDVRWCGNEAGHTRQSEWSVVPARTADTEKVASASQQADDTAFRRRTIRAEDEDLGSREALEGEDELIWYPAEVNTSIRPGWFWHESENQQVRPLEELFDIYQKSVGGNATFLLNVPPDTDGQIHPRDVQRLQELGNRIRACFAHNLCDTAVVEGAADGQCMLCDNDETWVAQGPQAQITLRWEQAQTIRRVVLAEQLRMSQRVERFCVDAWVDGQWKQVYEGTVIGYRKIAVVETVRTCALRIRIVDARVAPAIRFIGVYAPSAAG